MYAMSGKEIMHMQKLDWRHFLALWITVLHVTVADLLPHCLRRHL